VSPPKKSAAELEAENYATLWEVQDLRSLVEALEEAETSLQGFSSINSVDLVLTFETKVVVAHHDGTKWWVKFE
jgi:hypothetical protein